MEIKDLIETIKETAKRGNRIYICGNGGSACNSEHFAEDLLTKGIPAIALTAIGKITAIANDYSYKDVFSRQLEVIGNKGDLLITLSCSGTSKNIVKAHKTAKKIGMGFIAFPTNKETKTKTPITENVHQQIIHKVYLEL